MNRSLQKSIPIHATPDKVWRVFTDPETTKELVGSCVRFNTIRFSKVVNLT